MSARESKSVRRYCLASIVVAVPSCLSPVISSIRADITATSVRIGIMLAGSHRECEKVLRTYTLQALKPNDIFS